MSLRGFKIKDGDIVIKNGDICFSEGMDLIRQTVESVIGTNKGEWFLNADEGINFKNILIKNPDNDIIRNELINGLRQIDESFILIDYKISFVNRTLYINFEAKNNNDETIKGEYSYVK